MKLPAVLKSTKQKDLKDIPLREKILILANQYLDHKLGMAQLVPPSSSDMHDLQKLANMVSMLDENDRRNRAEATARGDDTKEITIVIEGDAGVVVDD